MAGRPTLYGFNDREIIMGYAVRCRHGWLVAVGYQFQTVGDKTEAHELLREYGAATIKEKRGVI